MARMNTTFQECGGENGACRGARRAYSYTTQVRRLRFTARVVKLCNTFQSSFTLAALMTLCQRSISSRI
jgi:hypothetical protein